MTGETQQEADLHLLSLSSSLFRFGAAPPPPMRLSTIISHLFPTVLGSRPRLLAQSAQSRDESLIFCRTISTRSRSSALLQSRALLSACVVGVISISICELSRCGSSGSCKVFEVEAIIGLGSVAGCDVSILNCRHRRLNLAAVADRLIVEAGTAVKRGRF